MCIPRQALTSAETQQKWCSISCELSQWERLHVALEGKELTDSCVMAKISISVFFAAPSGPNIAFTRTVTLEGGTQREESHYRDEEPLF